jgi:hypothetical protein
MAADRDRRAIVPSGGLEARRNPDPDEAPVVTLSAYAEVLVVERRSGWARVELPDGSGGALWVDGERLLEPGSPAVHRQPEPVRNEASRRVGAGGGCLLTAVGLLLFFAGALGAGLSSDRLAYDTSGSDSAGIDPMTTLWLIGAVALAIYGLYKAFGGRRPPRANRQADYERLQWEAQDQFPPSPFEAEEWPGEGDES